MVCAMQSTVNCMQIRPFFHKARQHIQMTCLILRGWFESTVQVWPFYLGFTSLRHSITQNEAVKEICSCRVKCSTSSALCTEKCQLSIVYIFKATYLFAKPPGNNMLQRSQVTSDLDSTERKEILNEIEKS